MSFFEHRMNPDLSFGAKGGPVFNTSKAYSQGGQRYGNKNWTAPLHRYDVQHCIKTKSDFDEIRNFFYNVAGSFDGFRFKDWADFESDGNGSMTLVSGSNYQLYKTYIVGARTYSRIIKKPVAGVQIYRRRAGVTSNITGSSTVTTSTGVVAVTGHAGGDTYTWSGEFDVPVAFASDEFMPIITNKRDTEFLMDSGPIMLEEIRL